jgi:hypothetical protein
MQVVKIWNGCLLSRTSEGCESRLDAVMYLVRGLRAFRRGDHPKMTAGVEERASRNITVFPVYDTADGSGMITL